MRIIVTWYIYLNFLGSNSTTSGKTYEEAAKHGQEVIESLIEWYQEQGKPLPEAIALPQKPLKIA